MYCDTEKDLRDVFSTIGQFQGKKLITKWDNVSGNADTYVAASVGYVELVFDDNTQLVEKTSIATVQATAGTFWLDSDNDLFYVHAYDSDDLTAASIPDIESGVDWDAFKTRMLNDAEEEMDSYLTRLYVTPLLPRLIKRHSTHDYESPIRLSCAYLTCRNIVRRLQPGNPVARDLEKLAINSNPDVGEEFGILDKLLKGDMYLQDQISPTDIGSVGNIDPNPDNSGTGYIWVIGEYSGSTQQRWRLQIDTAGAPGTATYKLSYDAGTVWNTTLQSTFNTGSDNRRIRIGSGIEVVFWGTFVLNDYWDFDLFPSTDTLSRPKISSTTMVRG